MAFNFLFPLGSTLSSFYIGIGKGRVVLWATLAINIINLGLAPLLIFGIVPWIPVKGVLGAALATGLCQCLFCAILFLCFFRKKERDEYGTGEYQLRWAILWESFKIGLPRSLTKCILIFAWLANTRLMCLKGGDFLLTFSIGSSLTLCFFFINEGMGKAIVTIAAYLIGKRDTRKMMRLLRSSLLFIFVTSAIFFFPCVLFPEKFLSLFLKQTFSVNQLDLLTRMFYWLWIGFICHGMNQMAFAMITAFGDTVFTLIYNGLSAWLLTYFPAFIFIELWDYPADTLYIIVAAAALFSAIVYLFRFSWQRERLSEKTSTISQEFPPVDPSGSGGSPSVTPS